MDSLIQLINSKYFIIQNLADGVYAALHRPGANAVANACIIDLGDQTLVFDTTLTPQSGTDLNLAAETLTDHQVTLVVNSHYHIDHTWGNQAFHPECDLIASEGTSRLMARKTPEEYRQLKDDTAEKARSLDQTISNQNLDLQVNNGAVSSQPNLWVSYISGILEALPRLRVRLPNITFDTQLTIHGSRRSVILATYSGGHTSSDTVLYLPEDGILCAGDLVYVDTHPYLSEAELDKAPRVLAELMNFDPQTVVPGHGPVASQSTLKSMLDYLDKLAAITAREFARTESADNLLKTSIPAAYNEWDLAHHFHPNLCAMFQHISREASGLLEKDLHENSNSPEAIPGELYPVPCVVAPDSI
ncbi:MAG: MBL fold metallo-hydrolase [Anaerolineales bacterium]